MNEESGIHVQEVMATETRLVSVTLGTSAKVNLQDYNSLDVSVFARWEIGVNDTRTVDQIAHDNRDALRGALVEQLGKALAPRVQVLERLVQALPAETSATAAKELSIIKTTLRIANAQEY